MGSTAILLLTVLASPGPLPADRPVSIHQWEAERFRHIPPGVAQQPDRSRLLKGNQKAVVRVVYGFFWSGSTHAGPVGMLRITSDWQAYQSQSSRC